MDPSDNVLSFHTWREYILDLHYLNKEQSWFSLTKIDIITRWGKGYFLFKYLWTKLARKKSDTLLYRSLLKSILKNQTNKSWILRSSWNSCEIPEEIDVTAKTTNEFYFFILIRNPNNSSLYFTFLWSCRLYFLWHIHYFVRRNSIPAVILWFHV